MVASMEAEMEGRLRQMPKKFRGLYKRAMSGRSRKAAIRSFCLECVCWREQEVESCPDLGCPLHPYRSNQHKGHLKSAKSKNSA